MKKALAWVMYRPARAVGVLAAFLTVVVLVGMTADYNRRVRDYEAREAAAAALAEARANPGANSPGALIEAPSPSDFVDTPATGDDDGEQDAPTVIPPPEAEAVEDVTVMEGTEEFATEPDIRAAAATFTTRWLTGRTAPDRAAWLDTTSELVIPAVVVSLETTPAEVIPDAKLVETDVVVRAAIDETAQVRAVLSNDEVITLDVVHDGQGWKVAYYGREE